MADEGRSLAPPTRKLQLVQIYIGGNYRVGKGRGRGHMAGGLGDPIIYGDAAVYLIDVQLKCTQEIPPLLCLSISVVVSEPLLDSRVSAVAY